MLFPRNSLRLAAVLTATILLAAKAQPEELDRIGTVRPPVAANWGGRLWTKTEMAGFNGRPQTATDNDSVNYITVAYDRYVSYYDLKRKAPVWVAYVTDRKSALEAAGGKRSDDNLPRPSGFFTDGVVAEASEAVGVVPAEHADYGDEVPAGLPEADRISRGLTPREASVKPAIIERGHMASNNTMKCWGNFEQGRKAQYESFSLANVVPEMRRHNSPVWSGLEKQCLAWAKELTVVAVVVGPIYNDRDHPRHIESRAGGVASDLPFPDALFCVVMGRRAGRMAAVGFIMPQTTENYTFKTKSVRIDEIERLTGINFMPALGEPNPLEESVDARWLK